MLLPRKIKIIKEINKNTFVGKKESKKIIIKRIPFQNKTSYLAIKRIIKYSWCPIIEIYNDSNNVYLIMKFVRGISGRIALFLPSYFHRIGNVLKEFHNENRNNTKEINFESLFNFKTSNKFIKSNTKKLIDLTSTDFIFFTYLHNDYSLRNLMISKYIYLIDYDGLFLSHSPNPFFNIFDVGYMILNIFSYYKLMFPLKYIAYIIKKFLIGYSIVPLDKIEIILKIVFTLYYYGIFRENQILTLYSHRKNFKIIQNSYEDFIFNNNGDLKKMIDLIRY